MIREATDDDLDRIAKLHIDNISTGFISELGLPLVKLIYKEIIDSEIAFCMVALSNSTIIGFIAGTTDINALYSGFIKNNFIKATYSIFTKLFKPRYMSRIIETLIYPRRRVVENIPHAELLSIVVVENYRRSKIGHKLFSSLCCEFISREVSTFKVLVGETIVSACKFYEKVGGALADKVSVHRGSKSRVYVWTV